MYFLHHRRYFNISWDYVLIGNADSKEEIAAIRKTSGDLVINSSGEIVTDPFWLFDWEKKDPNCYAQKAIAWQKLQQEKA